MQTSLIITTYNWKEALQLSLQSAFAQTCLPDEIIIADDGSRSDTAELIRQMAPSSPVALIHSWQEDKGFRLSMSRNKAIAQASGEYILLIDGDIVLDPHFVEDHLAFALRGHFIQGSRTLMNERLSTEILQSGHVQLSFWRNGIGNRKNALRSPLLARLFRCKSTSVTGIRCNFSFWKADAVHVNGYNEEFSGWGREDSEFAARLLHSGVQRINLRFCALAHHLHHLTGVRDRLAINDRILQQTLEEKRVWCERGINQYLELFSGQG